MSITLSTWITFFHIKFLWLAAVRSAKTGPFRLNNRQYQTSATTGQIGATFFALNRRTREVTLHVNEWSCLESPPTPLVRGRQVESKRGLPTFGFLEAVPILQLQESR